jgi:hypothetical protein
MPTVIGIIFLAAAMFYLERREDRFPEFLIFSGHFRDTPTV